MTKILVVDDEKDLEVLIKQKFRRQIREREYEFVFASDGNEALEKLNLYPDIDLALSDINMPGMDGLTLLGKLNEVSPLIKMVMVTAYSDMDNIRTAMNRGAFDFLTKPIDFADFESTIAKTVRHVEVLRDARRRLGEAERAHASLSRYFSPALAVQLAGGGHGLDLGGQRREVAALFTDIAGFTTLAETLDPSLLGALLNDYLEGMTDTVFAHDGTVTKIVGDAVHVLFGAPSDQPDHATRAVACALALDVWAEAFRERWRERGVEVGATRIGVHAGPAIVGNFGGGRFFDYTAYGDTINTAARLETVNKQLGTRLCVSASVAERAEDFRGRPIGDLVLRGRTEPLRAYEPLTAREFDEAATGLYLSAFAKLEGNEAGAMPAFAALLGMRENDCLASFHLKRLLNGGKGTRVATD